MPATAARKTANASNARLSTGPRTPQGKSRSSQNARTHGLTAAELIIGTEDREQFEAMLAGFQSDVAPQGAIQQTLFDSLVAAAWKLRQIRRMETELCSRADTLLDLLHDNELQSKLDRLARHHSRIERTFHRSLKELKVLQTEQAIRRLLPAEIHEKAAPLASPIEIAKRTQTGRSSPLVRSFPGAVELEWVAPPEPARAYTRPNHREHHLTASS